MKKSELAKLLAEADYDGLLAAASPRPWRVLRFLVGRLYSPEEDEKWHAVDALGYLAKDRDLLDEEKIVELLRRFLWSLNDESGAVPYGVPEALAEILANRTELGAEYIPILGSMLTSREMNQTGVIERGVIWGLGRLGSATVEHAPHALEALEAIAVQHDDPATVRAAKTALERIASCAQP